MNSEDAPYTANTGKPEGNGNYIFMAGFVLSSVLIVILTYTLYMCRRSRSPPPLPIISVVSSTSGDTQEHHVIRFSQGLDDDVLITLPTFLYSEAHKGGTTADAKDSGCSICLGDYKPEEVVRLLPECGHIFHVECIDMWLKGHSTCPVCRHSAVAGKVPLPVQQS